MPFSLLKNRLPKQNEFFAALGVVVFFVHSWAVRGFLHELPSFILYFKLGQILVIFFYMMGFALLESLLALLGLLMISIILPVDWFRNGFIYKSFVTMAVGAAAMLRLEYLIMASNSRSSPIYEVYIWAAITVGVWIFFLVFSHLFEKLQKSAIFIADRIGVMAYLYVPLGIIGLLVVLFRNLR